MNVTLHGHHARVLEEIFDHRSHNVEWRDVVSLVEHIGSVVERHDGKYEFQIGQTSTVFTKPRGKDVDVDALVKLRHLLTQAGIVAKGASQTSPKTSAPPNLPTVVLIDHHRARFFEYDRDTAHLEERDHIEPKDAHPLKQRETSDYYERVAERLKDTSAIVLAGDATGKSSAMLDLLEFLKDRHADVARRVVAAEHADLSGITLGGIEEIARKHSA